MKLRPNGALSQCVRLAPRGASGLKSMTESGRLNRTRSRPARGEWIEILASGADASLVKSRPARGEWIEIGS